MRGRTWIITAAVVAMGAVPAAATNTDKSLRRAPVVVPKPVVAPPPPPVVAPARPSAVWIPAPTTGIKWTVRAPRR